MYNAPTETSDIVKKDSVYEQFHAVQGRIPKYDIAIVLNDLNAKVGSDNTLLGYAMRKVCSFLQLPSNYIRWHIVGTLSQLDFN